MEGLDWGAAFTSAGLGALTASALILGALIGVYAKPGQKVVAAVMAFGSGALIAAVALELAGSANEKGGFLALSFGFMLGGILYWSLNAVIDSKGGFLRKRATRRRHIMSRKEQQTSRAAASADVTERLRHLPRQVADSLSGHVQVRHFEAGEVIFKDGDPGDSLFVINRGEVLLEGGASTAAEVAVDGALGQAWRQVFGDSLVGKLAIDEEPEEPETGGATSPEDGHVASLSDVAAVHTAHATHARDQHSRRFGPGESFGEMAILFDGTRACQAVAHTAVDVLRLDHSAWQHVVERSPRLSMAMSRVLAQRLGVASQHEESLEAEVSHWRDNGHGTVSSAEEHALHETHKEHSGAPLAIFMGALLDGIPESLVIGAEFVGTAAFNPTFVVAVFLSNLPEAMSSASGMIQGGYTIRRIMTLWTSLLIASTLAAFFGNIFLAPFAETAPTVIAIVNAVAGGGILAMLSATMMPEAFEQGGPAVSFSTIAGFLAAFFFHALQTAGAA